MTSTPAVPLVDLLDDFAINTMAQLIHIYSPQDMGDKEEMIQWCQAVASTSYVLASAMMDTRSALHRGIVDEFQGKESDAA
jgi:hypothetical protein